MAIFKGKRMVGADRRRQQAALDLRRNKGMHPHPVQEGHTSWPRPSTPAPSAGSFENSRLVLSINQAVMDAWGEGIFEPLAIAKYAAIERDLAGMIERT